MFDEMIAKAREQGSDDEFDEMHGTGETIGASDPAIVWQRFLESTGAYAGDSSLDTNEQRIMDEHEELYDDFNSDNEAHFSDDVSTTSLLPTLQQDIQFFFIVRCSCRFIFLRIRIFYYVLAR